MTKIFKKVEELSEYKKDLKNLLKKYRSLNDDLEIFIKTALKMFHKMNINNDTFFEINNLGLQCDNKIYKVKKFACKSLKGTGVRSGIRIIYTYFPETDTIQFIEIYHKNIKELEDKKIILKYFK